MVENNITDVTDSRSMNQKQNDEISQPPEFIPTRPKKSKVKSRIPKNEKAIQNVSSEDIPVIKKTFVQMLSLGKQTHKITEPARPKFIPSPRAANFPRYPSRRLKLPSYLDQIPENENK